MQLNFKNLSADFFSKISKILGINKRSLDRRLMKGTNFTIKDINSLKKHLNLTNDEVVEIFINE